MIADHPIARCWAEIDCAALRHNAAVAQDLAGPGTSLLAIVKADGYGHGMVPVAREFAAATGQARFGVANIAEAAQLQAHLPAARVTILSPALPGEREEIVRRRWLPWISGEEEAAAYARLAVACHGERAAPLEIELQVDTGMGRMGVLEPELEALRQAVARLPSLRVTGLVTHLPVPDEDRGFTEDQLARFDALAATPPPAGNEAPACRHAQNSAGLIGYPRHGCNAVRPGLMLYGSSPLPGFQARLRPVLCLKTRVALVRDLPPGRGISYGRTFITPRAMRVGTLAAGYADGYKRHLSNTGAAVLVRGQRCPLLGRVTMDQMMIDLSALPEAGPGEEVVLLGRQGGEEILAAELAQRAGTIPWEIFTSLTARIARYYLDPTPEGP
jgi:alanine racemase